MMNPKTEENKQETETAEEKDYEMLDDISRDKVKIKQFYQDQSLGMQELPAVMEIGDFAFARSSCRVYYCRTDCKRLAMVHFIIVTT